MRLRFFYIFLSCLLGNKALAQQDPQFTNYIFNGLFLNPATAGADGKTQLAAFYRNQYIGYSGTFDSGGQPVTQVLSASVPLKLLGGGVGVHIVNDQIGGGNINREIQLSYAYHLPLGGSRLSLGVSGGFHNKIANSENYRPRDPNDPAIPIGTVSQMKPDIGVGVYLYNPAFTLGLSSKHIAEPAFGLGTPSATNTLKRSYYLTGSVLIGVSYTLDVSPMFILKSDLTTLSPEVGALITYVNKYWAGTNYRWDDAISLMAGGTFLNQSLRIGYAFDYVYAGIEAKSPTSHEIMISYALPAPKSGKKSIIRTPRYRF